MKLSDFKGNFKQINEFKSFLAKTTNHVMLIVGDNGTGKTAFHEMLRSENKYDILYVNDSNFSEETIQNFVQCKTITSFFTPLKKLVFVDDVDIINNINKQFIANFTNYKSKCKFVLTVKSKEEKKIHNTWKKLIDYKIHLNKLDYKECFQVLLKMFEHRDDIDESKLLELIKAQNCNISNTIMLIDNVTDKQDNVSVIQSNMDIFHKNIYDIVNNIYTKELSSQYIQSLSSKDNSVISSMVHENIVNINTDIDTYIKLYDVLSYCDKIDKYIYINCLWGINWDSLNMYRFTNFNSILFKIKKHTFSINFTQQFTKLSSQMNIKKKLQSFINNIYTTNTFDLLYHLAIQTYDDIQKDKTLKDLLTKFKKDFVI